MPNPEEHIDTAEQEARPIGQQLKDALWDLWSQKESKALYEASIIKSALKPLFPDAQDVVAWELNGHGLGIYPFRVDQHTPNERIGFAYSAPADGEHPDLPGRGMFVYEAIGDEVEGTLAPSSDNEFSTPQPFEVNRIALSEFITTQLKLPEDERYHAPLSDPY